MQFEKLAATDGFIVYDLDDAPAVGVVRLAPKVLRDGAELLARSTTYLMASFGVRQRGASAGLNAKPDGRDAAVAAFVAEVRDLVEADRFLPGPGLGVTSDDLADLPRAEARAQAFDQTSAGESAVAAALGALGSLEGRRVAIVGGGPVADAAAASASANGASPAPQAAFDADCDVLLVAGKAGVLDHDHAATVRAKVVVPLTPVPVTARALAVLGRAESVVVPDFISTAAPLLAAVDPDGGDPMARVHDVVAGLSGEGTNLWMAAALRAEDFLRTWQPELPFGRPLA